MDTALVSVTDLTRTYGVGNQAFQAVEDVSFYAHAGELFALLGTNGAGKTSTMEVVEGLARAGSGTVRVCGLDPVTDRRQLRPRIGIMLQEAGFSSGMTTRAAMAMWAGTMARPRPVDESLALVNLTDRAHVQVQLLSGGERRRLDLALAIMGRPQVLFLDEPTTGLDPESRAQAWDLLRDLLDLGTCIVLTTHYLDEAERLANRIAIMHEGSIRRHGTLAEVISGAPGRIEFVADADLMARLGPLPQLLGGAVTRRNERLSITTESVQQHLRQLLSWSAGVELPGLRASAASLEQVFLAIAEGQDILDQPASARSGSPSPVHSAR